MLLNYVLVTVALQNGHIHPVLKIKKNGKGACD